MLTLKGRFCIITKSTFDTNDDRNRDATRYNASSYNILIYNKVKRDLGNALQWIKRKEKMDA